MTVGSQWTNAIGVSALTASRLVATEVCKHQHHPTDEPPAAENLKLCHYGRSARYAERPD